MGEALAMIAVCAVPVAILWIAAWVFVSLLTLPVGQMLIGCVLFAMGFCVGRAWKQDQE
jgi:hypothetical protein